MVKQTKRKILEPTKTKGSKAAQKKKPAASSIQQSKSTKNPVSTKQQSKSTKNPASTKQQSKSTKNPASTKQQSSKSTKNPASTKQQSKKSGPATRQTPEQDTLQTEEEASQCSICLDTNGVEIQRILACGHGFHQFCINRWFLESRAFRCPVCRADQSRHVIGMEININGSGVNVNYIFH